MINVNFFNYVIFKLIQILCCNKVITIKESHLTSKMAFYGYSLIQWRSLFTKIEAHEGIFNKLAEKILH